MVARQRGRRGGCPVTVAYPADEAPLVVPSRQNRLLLAALIAGLAAVFTWYQHGYLVARLAPPDSLYLWRAANVLLDGANPWSPQALNYAVADSAVRSVESRIRLVDPLYYPMPAVLLWAPLAKFPYLVASTVFNAFAAFVFVFAMTRDGLYRAWACGSVPFIVAMRFGQWSPLLAAAWVYPWLSAFLVAKPNLGLPLYAAKPSRAATLTCTLALGLPTLVAPWWVRDWLHNIQNDMGRTAPHPAPVTMFAGAGALCLLALWRWRRPDARLLAFMACVPQLPYWADQLPLMLIPRGRREMQMLMLATLAGFLCWAEFGRSDPSGDVIDSIRPFSIVFTYAPALLLVMRRQNVGRLPAWLERVAAYLPAALRGTSSC